MVRKVLEHADYECTKINKSSSHLMKPQLYKYTDMIPLPPERDENFLIV
jgi:hypothetical protein